MIKKISRKGKIAMGIGLIVVLLIGFICWLLFLPKKYTFFYHLSGNRNIERAEILLYGSDEYSNSSYIIEDRENLDKLEKVLKETKLSPYYMKNYKENSADEEGFLLHLYGKNEIYYSLMTDGKMGNEDAVVFQNLMKNGLVVKDYMILFSGATITQEQQKQVRTVLMEVIKSEIKQMTAEDILYLGKEKIQDATKFEKYFYREKKTEEEMELLNKTVLQSEIPEDMSIDSAEIFETNQENMFVAAWRMIRIRDMGNGKSSMTQEIVKALVYQNGQCIDLYGDGLEEFLEVEK